MYVYTWWKYCVIYEEKKPVETSRFLIPAATQFTEFPTLQRSEILEGFTFEPVCPLTTGGPEKINTKSTVRTTYDCQNVRLKNP